MMQMMVASEAPYLTLPQGMLRSEGFKGEPADTPDPPSCSDRNQEIMFEANVTLQTPCEDKI